MAKIVACGTCRQPLTHAARPHRSDPVTCDRCGTSDSFEEVMREAGSYLRDRVAATTSETLRDLGSWLAWLSDDGPPAPPRTYRYIMVEPAPIPVAAEAR